MTKTILFTLAFIVGLPALIIIANVTMYALTGQTILPTAVDYMNAARGAVAWLSFLGGMLLVIAGTTK